MSSGKQRQVMTGAGRAAQFLMVIGEERAAAVLKQLSAEEVQKIGVEMTRMEGLTTDMVNEVLENFLVECETNSSISVENSEYTKQVLIQALGAEAAENILEKILLGGNTKGLDSLRWMEPQLIAGIIKNEHPQVQAIVISYLSPEHAGEVLSFLPESVVIELLIRLVQMESVDPKALQELNFALEKQVEGVVSKQSSAVGGVKSVANIFNTLDRSTEDAMMKKIANVDPGIATSIQELMYVFEDLKLIPDKDFQLLLREVATDKLILAMKGAEKSMIEKVTGNMSSRASEIFKDDLENTGPVKVTDVEAAQKEIIAVAKALSDSGKIVLKEDAAAMIG